MFPALSRLTIEILIQMLSSTANSTSQLLYDEKQEIQLFLKWMPHPAMRFVLLYRLVMQLYHYLSSWHNYRTIGHVRDCERVNLVPRNPHLKTVLCQFSNSLRNLTRPSASSCTSARTYNARLAFARQRVFCAIYGHTPLGRIKGKQTTLEEANSRSSQEYNIIMVTGQILVNSLDGVYCYLLLIRWEWGPWNNVLVLHFEYFERLCLSKDVLIITYFVFSGSHVLNNSKDINQATNHPP